MITVQEKDYGFHFTFSSPITLEDAAEWRDQMKIAFSQPREDCFVFADLRKCELIPSECKPLVGEVQEIFRKNGMKRSVVIVSDPITTMQMKIVARETGIREWERYIDSSSDPNWEQSGLDWILRGIDPEELVTTSSSDQYHQIP